MTELEPLFPAEKTQFALLCLANYAEVQNSLLYMTGGGWNEYRRPAANEQGQRPMVRLGVALIIQVPWSETNREQKFRIVITDLDGKLAHLIKIEGGLSAGRPGMMPAGTIQYINMAFNVEVNFPQAGSYMLRGLINEDPASAKSWEFRVIDPA
jgi:hypothetical protein